MMLKNGFLVSCAYDHKIHFWDYFKGEVIETLTRKKEEFWCISYLDWIGILLAGTNGKSILTFNIQHILENWPEANNFKSERDVDEAKEELDEMDSIDQ